MNSTCLGSNAIEGSKLKAKIKAKEKQKQSKAEANRAPRPAEQPQLNKQPPNNTTQYQHSKHPSPRHSFSALLGDQPLFSRTGTEIHRDGRSEVQRSREEGPQ